MAQLLIVDDDANTLASLARAFRMAGHEATVCDNADRALELLKSQPFDMMMSDVVMPGKDGLTLLEEARAAGITLPVVMISGQANIEMAVRATKLGAKDFLEKPLSTEKLLLTIDNTLQLKRLEAENRELRQRVGKHEIVHSGEAMRRVMAQVDRVAASESRVCILGETGTGKELIARALHERSARRGQPFVTLNCAAVPGELIESELFGHEKGSFTGAVTRHIGRFEQANHGTLFLDEIGDMPLVMQAKLLRVLEEGQVERVGGDRSIPVNVRVIVATHRNLDELVKKGAFRQDLYHRIYVFPLAAAAIARAYGGYPRTGLAFRRASGGAKRMEGATIHARCHPRIAALSLARQRARVAQRSGTFDASGRWRSGRSHRAHRITASGWRRRGRHNCGGRSSIRRPALTSRGCIRARTDPRGTQAQQSAHDGYSARVRTRAQPSL